MKLEIIVLLKQVPDTRNVSEALMTAEGLVNRNALPAIVNPQDLFALSEALSLKSRYPGSVVRLLTMGPPSAADVLREGLWRGADSVVLLSDRALGGADTLATSYALALAIRKMGMPDFIFCGHQSLDGDTAHVGPQVAEFLGVDQVTNCKGVSLLDQDKKELYAVQKRHAKQAMLSVAPPALVAFSGSSSWNDTYNAHALLTYKHAATKREQAMHPVLTPAQFESRPYLTIEQWDANDIGAERHRVGLQGSPTRVVHTEAVSFTPKGGEQLTDSDADIAHLVEALTALNHG